MCLTDLEGVKVNTGTEGGQTGDPDMEARACSMTMTANESATCVQEEVVGCSEGSCLRVEMAYWCRH